MQSPFIPSPAPSAAGFPAPIRSDAGRQGSAAPSGQLQLATQQSYGAGPTGMMRWQTGITQAGNVSQQGSFDWIKSLSDLAQSGQNTPTKGRAPADGRLPSSKRRRRKRWGNPMKMPSKRIEAQEPLLPMNSPFMNTQVSPALGHGEQKPQSSEAPANDYYIMPQSLARQIWESYLPKWPTFYCCGYFEVPVHPSVDCMKLVAKDIVLVQKYMDPNHVHVAVGYMTKPNSDEVFGRKLIMTFVDEKVKDECIAHERLLVGWNVLWMWYQQTVEYYENPGPEKKLQSLLEVTVQTSKVRIQSVLGDINKQLGEFKQLVNKQEAEEAVSELVTAATDFTEQLSDVESWVQDMTRNPCIQESQRRSFAGKIFLRDGDLRGREQKLVEKMYHGAISSATPGDTPAAAGGTKTGESPVLGLDADENDISMEPGVPSGVNNTDDDWEDISLGKMIKRENTH